MYFANLTLKVVIIARINPTMALVNTIKDTILGLTTNKYHIVIIAPAARQAKSNVIFSKVPLIVIGSSVTKVSSCGNLSSFNIGFDIIDSFL